MKKHLEKLNSLSESLQTADAEGVRQWIKDFHLWMQVWLEHEAEFFSNLPKKDQKAEKKKIEKQIDELKKLWVEKSSNPGASSSKHSKENSKSSFHAQGTPYSASFYKKASPPMLCLDRVCRAPKESEISITIESETWSEKEQAFYYGLDCLQVRYSLRIRVDDDSGNDQAPQPEIQELPLAGSVRGNTYPAPSELPGISLTGDSWDAWYGNDAPEITKNKLNFGDWKDDRIFLEWSGKYQSDITSRIETLRFKGEARFSGIRCSVRTPGDEERFFLKLWSTEERERFVKIELGKQDLGESFAPERRYSWSYLFQTQ